MENPMTYSLPAEAEELIPHRGGMKLIDQLTSYSEDDGTATIDVQANNLFLNEQKQLDNVVLVELLAQTAAAHSGYKAHLGTGKPMFGFLVGVKDFKIFGSAGIGDSLTLSIHRDFQLDNVTFLAGKVLRGNDLLAEGILKLWEMTDTKIEVPQIPVSSQNSEPVKLVNDDQIKIINASSLSRKIFQQCTHFKLMQELNSVEADFNYQHNFVGFEGHFPGSPIVPGVLMLKTGLLIAELAGYKKLSLSTICTTKFAKTVLPNETIRYSLSIKENKIKAQVKTQDSLCAKFTLEVR